MMWGEKLYIKRNIEKQLNNIDNKYDFYIKYKQIKQEFKYINHIKILKKMI